MKKLSALAAAALLSATLTVSASASSLSHTVAQGDTMWKLAVKYQVGTSEIIAARSAGENIACGYGTPAAVVNGWMNSSGHRANILNASYTQIGVGYYAGGNYWTQMFIG